MSAIHTCNLSDDEAVVLQKLLVAGAFTPRTIPYARYSFCKSKLSVTLYEKSGRLVVQGADTERFVHDVLNAQVLDSPTKLENAEGDATYQAHFGVDESGKGDYFGPLVIAGVYVDVQIARSLRQAGVCDSKTLKEPQILALAELIRQTPNIAYKVLSLGPAKYNELYGRMKNLNSLLAWGHSQVIAGLAEAVPSCRHALSDQFAHPRVLSQALAKMHVDVELSQRTKAESDTAVAAASILARERFVLWMQKARVASGCEIPFGASASVLRAAKQLVAQFGAAKLPEVAKMHFKTTQKVFDLGL